MTIKKLFKTLLTKGGTIEDIKTAAETILKDRGIEPTIDNFRVRNNEGHIEIAYKPVRRWVVAR
jgi:hypothetical protein